MPNYPTINIACASDDNFAQHLCVMLYSLACNISKKRHTKITVLDGGISASNKTKIIDSLTQFMSTGVIDLEFLAPNPERYAKMKTTAHLTTAAYFRLSLPELLPATKKIIYLDCDLVIEDDISQLFDQDMHGSCILAVKDSSPELWNEYEVDFKIPNQQGYFNSGVMVWDLAQMRETGFSSRVFECLVKIQERATTMDQTALNIVASNCWSPISPSWNQLAGVSIESNHKNTTYTEVDFNSAKNSPKIIHFSSPFAKPWNYDNISPFGSRYHHYLALTEFRDYKPHISIKVLLLKIIYALYFIHLPNFARTWIHSIYLNTKSKK
jgi:lipopolysaccharide biosynthesis glycosyltransferase